MYGGENTLALRRAQFDSFRSPVPTVYTDSLWAATLNPGYSEIKEFSHGVSLLKSGHMPRLGHLGFHLLTLPVGLAPGLEVLWL